MRLPARYFKFDNLILLPFSESRYALDLVFAVDGSDSVTDDQFDIVKETVRRMLQEYTISPLDTRVSIIEYSDKPTVLVYLNSTFDLKDLTAKINNMVPSKGASAMVDKALGEVKNVLSFAKGGRPGAAKAVVILTDGDSSSPSDLDEMSESLKEDGTRVYVMIIGDGTDQDEIVKVVSVPEDVFPVVHPSDLPKVRRQITDKVKNDVKKGE